MTKTLLRAPFRADHVGSFLRPERLKKARLQKQNGEITADQLRKIEDEEIIRLVAKQKEAGLQAVSDGEFRRAWWHFDFLAELEGVELYEADSGLQFNGVQTKAHGIRVIGKVDFGDHPMLEHYKFLHQIAGDHTAKFTIPSPNMLLLRAAIQDGVYDSREELFDDLVQAYQKAIQAFYEAGCRYLQLDDTSWAAFLSEDSRQKIIAGGDEPKELAELFARAVNESIAQKPDDMTITMHICRGNFKSTFMSSGGYDYVSEIIFGGLNVDGLFLEFDDERSGGFNPLRHVTRDDLQIVLGLITSKYGELEQAGQIKARIEEASRYLNLNQLCLSPQCGFASTEEGNILTEEQQWEKIKHVINIADDVWK
ncbi:5-methyltetrahydropteroyltriglutamate--homocysteine S-methyltransferase [Peribacillus deserti]|uniref:5-methyltetrahydropteroyltriglutamate--homocysteine methyltransferase n=1 Tax=Peribacillus deserti TaxID=673318 RepID=A0A2N5M6H2_9BACI|nr:5-methyltetrahydropteroyltriglutamate--homocysteine S-methyltransferase [Peribacillus deserti]PLT29947.1 5-methyltetrahydropteroyltriglutamate--homocysteine methyltransferase [Peribacillus deserti]